MEESPKPVVLEVQDASVTNTLTFNPAVIAMTLQDAYNKLIEKEQNNGQISA